MAPFVQAKQAGIITAREGGKGLKRQMSRNISAVLGAVGGSALGGVPGMIAGLGLGVVGGPALVAPAMRASEAMRVPMTMKVAGATQQLASGATQGLIASSQAGILNAIARAGQVGVPMATRAIQEAMFKNEPREWEEENAR